MKTYHAQLEVRGYELDSFGHVNHANYLNYLEHARWKMLEAEGITLELLQQCKRWPVIAQLEIKYLKPTFMGDLLDVETRCLEHGKASFVFEQIIMRAGTPVLKARIQGVMVNENGRPADYPEQFAKIWS
jgi:YbgC/YbaW family acyl-CoA thioester hydrolase